MTLESLSMCIVRPLMVEHPYAWAFFVPFILITSFAVINLFIGVIVDSMQTQHADETGDIRGYVDPDADALRDEIAALRDEMAVLAKALEVLPPR